MRRLRVQWTAAIRGLTVLLVALVGSLSMPAIARADSGDLVVSPNPVNFDYGNVPVGDEAVRSVTVTNVSAGPVTVTVTGGLLGRNPDFDMTTTCRGVVLDPQQSCSFTYRFRPTVAGPLAGSTAIGVNGSTVPVDLSGTGVAAAPAATSTTAVSTLVPPTSNSATVPGAVGAAASGPPTSGTGPTSVAAGSVKALPVTGTAPRLLVAAGVLLAMLGCVSVSVARRGRRKPTA